MIEWSTPLTIARVGKAAFDHRHFIQGAWTWLKAALNLGATQVVVTGITGAGKTLLMAQLEGRGRTDSYDEPGESMGVEVDAIRLGKWSKLVRVLPGQSARRVHGEISAFQSNEHLEGLIHVVDFGYSAPRDPVVARTLVENDALHTVEELRARNLQLEIDALRLEIGNIRRSFAEQEKPKWIVVAVNKVDLFWGNRADALRHYHPEGNSEFSKILRDLLAELGTRNIACYVIPCCATEVDFNWNGHLVASALPRQQQVALLRDFRKSLSLISRAHP